MDFGVGLMKFFKVAQVVVLGGMFAASAAEAQQVAQKGIQVPPACSSMRDKIGCACALTHGGGWVTGDGQWRYGNSVSQTEGYTQCMRANGRL
jgi:hypothetical protein